MPIYEYRCDRCGQEYELFRNVTDRGNPSCKFCGGPGKKLISRSSFHLKGTGWYVTDYAGKKSTGQEEKQEEKKEAPAESSSEGAKKGEPATSKGED